MKRIQLLLPILIAIFTSCEHTTNAKLTSKSSEEKIIPEFSDSTLNGRITNRQACQICDIIDNALKEDVTRSAEDLSMPDHFGGLYINDSNQVVVLLTDTALYKKVILRKIQTPNIIFRQCTYSQNTLQKISNEIFDILSIDKDLTLARELDIVHFGITVTLNRVEIGINNCTAEKITKFRSKVYDSPALVFSETHGRLDIKPATSPAPARIR